MGQRGDGLLLGVKEGPSGLQVALLSDALALLTAAGAQAFDDRRMSRLLLVCVESLLVLSAALLLKDIGCLLLELLDRLLGVHRLLLLVPVNALSSRSLVLLRTDQVALGSG